VGAASSWSSASLAGGFDESGRIPDCDADTVKVRGAGRVNRRMGTRSWLRTL
jgi:hypothetical protein